MEPSAPLSDVDFECRMDHAGAALAVTYLIHNRSAVEIGVFNRIRGVLPDGGLDYAPDLCWIDLEGDTVLLRKMALPLPPGLGAAGYTPPDASRVAPRGTLRETFRVPIPIRVCHPFKRAMVRGEVVADKLSSASKAIVSIGVFPLVRDVRLIASHPAFPDVLSPFPPGPALALQATLSAAFLLDPPIVVLDYRGAAWT